MDTNLHVNYRSYDRNAADFHFYQGFINSPSSSSQYRCNVGLHNWITDKKDRLSNAQVPLVCLDSSSRERILTSEVKQGFLKRLQLSESVLVEFGNGRFIISKFIWDDDDESESKLDQHTGYHAWLTWVKSWSVNRCNSRGLKQFWHLLLLKKLAWNFLQGVSFAVDILFNGTLLQTLRGHGGGAECLCFLVRLFYLNFQKDPGHRCIFQKKTKKKNNGVEFLWQTFPNKALLLSVWLH